MKMLGNRITAYVVVAMVLLGLGGDAALARKACSTHGSWPADWPKGLDAWRDRATTLRAAPLGQDGFYTVTLEGREAFEKGWAALLEVPRADHPTLTLVSEPPEDVARKALGGRCPGRPVVQVRYYRSFGENGEKSQEVAVGITLFVDGKIVDLNRVRIPAGYRIEDRRTLSVKTAGRTAQGTGKKSEQSR
jgi:hypothetical protein